MVALFSGSNLTTPAKLHSTVTPSTFSIIRSASQSLTHASLLPPFLLSLPPFLLSLPPFLSLPSLPPPPPFLPSPPPSGVPQSQTDPIPPTTVHLHRLRVPLMTATCLQRPTLLQPPVWCTACPAVMSQGLTHNPPNTRRNTFTMNRTLTVIRSVGPTLHTHAYVQC